MPMSRTWNAKRPEVPVDRDGNWLHYPQRQYAYVDGKYTSFDIEWKVVEPFWAHLEVVTLNTGRSAKYVTVKDVDRRITYPMFVSDLIDVIRYAKVENGRISALWTASKRGQNYGIKVVKP